MPLLNRSDIIKTTWFQFTICTRNITYYIKNCHIKSVTNFKGKPHSLQTQGIIIQRLAKSVELSITSIDSKNKESFFENFDKSQLISFTHKLKMKMVLKLKSICCKYLFLISFIWSQVYYIFSFISGKK